MKKIFRERGVLTKPFSVLHVDGDMLMRNILKKTLSGDLFQLDSAANGREAFQLLEQRHFAYDIVITEMHMHFANGYEIVNRLSRHYPASKVIITSNMSFFHIREGLDITRENYFKKPLVIGQLMERITAILIPESLAGTPYEEINGEEPTAADLFRDQAVSTPDDPGLDALDELLSADLIGNDVKEQSPVLLQEEIDTIEAVHSNDLKASKVFQPGVLFAEPAVAGKRWW